MFQLVGTMTELVGMPRPSSGARHNVGAPESLCACLKMQSDAELEGLDEHPLVIEHIQHPRHAIVLTEPMVGSTHT